MPQLVLVKAFSIDTPVYNDLYVVTWMLRMILVLPLLFPNYI